MDLKNAQALTPAPGGVLIINRDTLALIACIGLGVVYANSMFFRISGVNSAGYLIILGGAGAYFLSDTRRSLWGYMVLPIMLLFNENLAFGYLILLFLQKDGVSPRALDRDKDILVLLLLGSLILAYKIATEGVAFHDALGFVGRLEIGFAHPNLAPIFTMMLAYYARYYWSRWAAVLAYALFAASVALTGSLGKIPLVLFFLCSGWLFHHRRIAYPLTFLSVILVSLLILLSSDPAATKISSGRNLIYQQVLEVMGWKSLLFTVPQSELVNLAILRDFYGNDLLTAMPFDSIVSAATAFGLLPSLLLGLMAGLFGAPVSRKDFDRRMMFWIFGFTSNPLSFWNPLLLFALKRSPPERAARPRLPG